MEAADRDQSDPLVREVVAEQAPGTTASRAQCRREMDGGSVGERLGWTHGSHSVATHWVPRHEYDALQAALQQQVEQFGQLDEQYRAQQQEFAAQMAQLEQLLQRTKTQHQEELNRLTQSPQREPTQEPLFSQPEQSPAPPEQQEHMAQLHQQYRELEAHWTQHLHEQQQEHQQQLEQLALQQRQEQERARDAHEAQMTALSAALVRVLLGDVANASSGRPGRSASDGWWCGAVRCGTGCSMKHNSNWPPNRGSTRLLGTSSSASNSSRHCALWRSR